MIVDSALYVCGRREPGRFDTAAAAAMRRPDAFSWTGLFEPTKAEFHQIRRHIDLHDLVVEDALNAHQRPKLEQYDDDLFVVLRTASYVEGDEVQFGELQIFVTKRAVLHVRHNSPSKLVGVRQSLEQLPDRLACGPGSVLHAIVDHVVDDYEPVVDGLEKDVREVERAVFTRVGGGNPVEQIYVLMRNVLTVQDALTPLLGPLHALATQPFEVIHEDLQEYFRDVHDHLAAVVQRVGTMHDLVTTILAANLTSVSVRQNEDMRKISAWVAIAAVPTMIAGIYGMNFDHMPELRSTWGYPFAILLMAFVCVSLYRKFRSSGWL
ncbi:MAG TPA: magnesium and cobalt transport protein CorA [Ilumatobacteraceae bacterium]